MRTAGAISLKAASQAGISILAGSDVPNPGMFPGPGLHDELEALVRAGLSPLEALQAATVNAAAFLGLADLLGSVTPGKLADLLVLDANPVEDVTRTRAIRIVVANGRIHDRVDLDALLAAIEAFAQQDTASMRHGSGM